MSETSYFLKHNGKVERTTFPYTHGAENKEWNSIPQEQFLSVKEIAKHQLSQLTTEQLQEFKNIPQDDLIGLHHGYGMWIRNNYALWHPKNPYVIPGDLGDCHPDGLSQRAIEEMHRMLNTFIPTEPGAFERAMSVVESKALDRAFEWEQK